MMLSRSINENLTLDEAVAEVEARFKIGPKGFARLAPTGEEYVELISGGIKKEGERSLILADTPELAIRYWLNAVWDYAGLHGPDQERKTLYWRILPEMDELLVRHPETPKEEFSYWRIYSRLLITDKPPIAAEQEVPDGAPVQ